MQLAVQDFVKRHEGRLSVSVDADQVLCPAFQFVMRKINDTRGANHTFEEMAYYPSSKDQFFFGVPYSEFRRLYDESWANEWHLIENLADRGKIAKLATQIDLDVVSSRGEEAASPLIRWVEHNHPGTFGKVLIVPNRSDKSELDYTIFIDDAPRIAGAIEARDDKLLLLVDAPYNRDIPDTQKVVRVADVNEAVDLLLSCTKRD